MLRASIVGLVALVLAACSSSGEGTRSALGAECQADNARCESGLCHSLDSATSVCTKTCSTNADCPDEMLCDRVPSRGSLCLPTGLGGRCRADDECPAGHKCDVAVARCYIPVTRELCSPCTSPLQCPTGGHCTRVEATGEQYCTVACTAGECPAGFRCAEVAGAGQQCVPDNASITCSAGKSLCSPCRGDSECGDFSDICVRNLASSETFCGESCARDSDCPSGFACLDLSGRGQGPYQCVPNSGTCRGFCDSTNEEAVRRQCGLGAQCDAAARRCEPATDGRQCATCEDDDDCPSSAGTTRCVVNNCPDCPYKGQKFCSVTCAGAGGQPDASICGAGFLCVGLGAGGTAGPWHCAPRSGTCQAGAGELGDDCTARGAAACLSGICLGFGAQSVCSFDCQADGDCGDGRFKCCAVTENGESFDCAAAPGALGGVCSPRGGGFGADCSPGQPPCFQGSCLDLGTARVCTVECADSACPSGFSCRTGRRPKGDGSFDDVKVCFPDGGGDIGADCTFGPAACSSGLCIKKRTGNICTSACGEGGTECPTGYRCTEDVTTVDGQKLDVCVPTSL